MSEFSAELLRLRDLGLPKYLATCLKVTEKTVSRWWDAGLIPNTYRTPGGHRRIHYSDETIETVLRTVFLKKEKNRAIAGGKPIKWRGRNLETKGCRNTQDLYNRALQNGFCPRDAELLASVPRGGGVPSFDPETIWFDLVYTATDVLPDDPGRKLPLGPGEHLRIAQAQSEEAFRREAQQIWAELLANYGLTEESFRRYSEEHATEGFPEAEQLLHMQTKAECLHYWNVLIAPVWRPLEIQERVLQHLQIFTRSEPRRAFLLNQALILQINEQPLTATRLAEPLNISRRKLYREFGTEMIRASLKMAQKRALQQLIEGRGPEFEESHEITDERLVQAPPSRRRNWIGDSAAG